MELTCKSCKFINKNPNDPLNSKSFVCVRYPPIAQLIANSTQLGAQIMTITVYVPVTENSPACGEYHRN